MRPSRAGRPAPMKWVEELELSPEEKRSGTLRGPRSYPYPFLEVPSGITAIDDGVFKGNGAVEVVQLPETLRRIGRQAFAGCTNLKQILGTAGLQSLGDEAFSGCARLQEAPMPPGLQEIGTRAFAGCSSLRTVDIPESVQKLGRQPFCHCIAFPRYSLPEKLRDAQKSCEEQLGIPDRGGFLIWDGELELYRGRTHCVVVPADVSSIRAGAFDDSQVPAEGMEIRLPDSVRMIDRSAAFLNRKVKMNLPAGYLRQARALPALATAELLDNVWKNEYLAADLVSLYLFQGSTLLNKAAELLEERDPAQMAELMRRRVEEAGLTGPRRQRAWARLAEFCFAHAEDLPRDWKERHFLQPGDPAALVLQMNHVDPDSPLIAQVRAADGEKADPETVRCLLASYLAEGLHCERLEQAPRLVPAAESAAAGLDIASLQKVLPELLPEMDLGSPQLYPYCRFASSEQVRPLAAAIAPARSSRSGGRRGRPRAEEPDPDRVRPLFLSSAEETLLQMVLTDAGRPGSGLLRDYLRTQADAPGAPPVCFPAVLGLSPDGSKTYRDTSGVPLVRLEFSAGTFDIRDLRTGRKRRSVPAMPGDVNLRVRISQDVALIQEYYAALTEWLRRGQQDSFLLGTSLDGPVWRRLYSDPFLKAEAAGVIWEQGGRQFVWDGAYARSSRGRRIRVDQEAPVRVAHPLDMTEAELAGWESWAARRMPTDLFRQLDEPVYTLSEIQPDRYAGCYVEAWDLQKAEPQLQLEQSLRRHRNALAIGSHGSLEASAPVSTRGSARLKLGELQITEMNRTANHTLYLLDLWTLKQRIARDDISTLKVLKTTPREQLGSYLDLAVKSGAGQLTAALLEYSRDVPQAGSEEFSLDN